MWCVRTSLKLPPRETIFKDNLSGDKVEARNLSLLVLALHPPGAMTPALPYIGFLQSKKNSCQVFIN